MKENAMEKSVQTTYEFQMVLVLHLWVATDSQPRKIAEFGTLPRQ
jgi:hypothetical protein